MNYRYKAVISGVYDGDTVTADLDLGLGITSRQKLRLNRINAPEMRGEDRPHGIVARDRLRELVLGKEVEIQTIRDQKGKYGRYLAEIYLNENINDLLVREGLAREYE